MLNTGISNTGTRTQLLSTTFNAAGSFTIPDYSLYDALFIVIQGDANNGSSIYIPKGMFDMNVPFSIYSSNNSNLVENGGYSIRAHGRYSGNGGIIVAHAAAGNWGKITLAVYGIK